MNEALLDVMTFNLATTTQLPMVVAATTTEAWFTPEQAGMYGGVIGGAGFGGILVGAIGGGVCGPLAGLGKARKFVMSYIMFLGALGLALLGTSIYALITGQPYHVWYAMMLPGTLGVFFGVGGFFLFREIYSKVEQRKLDAASLRTA